MTETTGYWWADLRAPDGSRLPHSVNVRVSWYERQTRQHRYGFYASEVAVLLLTAAIPASAAAGASTVVTGVLGAVATAGVGLRQLFRWGENWIRLSGSLVALQGELVKWSYGEGPFGDPATAADVLASKVETLVQSETTAWVATRRAGLSATEPQGPSESGSVT